MNKKHIKRFVILMFLLIPVDVFSCSCAKFIGSIEEHVADELSNSSAVFLGTVEKIEKVGPHDDLDLQKIVKVHFKVSKSWKYISGNTAIVSTITQCCLCGYNFIEGMSYLVYANSPDNRLDDLWASICSRTTLLINAKKDLEILDKLTESK